MTLGRGWDRSTPGWLCLGLLLAACAAREQSPPKDGSESARDPATGAAVENVAAIVYELHGGIAGFDHVLHVRPSGSGGAAAGARAEVTEGGLPSRSGIVSSADWQALKQLVAAADLPHVKPAYGREGAVADAFHEVLAVEGDHATTRITVISDMADEPPEALRVLLERLRELALTLSPAP